jgi:hypothetical protein
VLRALVLIAGAWLALLQGAFAAAASPQLGSTIALGGLEIVTTTPIPPGAARGFAPVTVRVRNVGTRPERLEMELGGFGYNQQPNRQEWTLDVPPGESVTSELLVNIDRLSRGGSKRLYLESDGDRRDVRLEYFDDYFNPRARAIQFLGAAELADTIIAARRAELPLTGSSHAVLGAESGSTRGSGSQIARIGSSTFEDLPRMAAGWSAVDTVFVNVDRDLPASSSWEPLLEWVDHGGQVAFVGRDLGRRLREVEGLRIRTRGRYGLEVPGPSLTVPFEGDSKIQLYRSGFGSIALCEYSSLDVDFFDDSTPSAVNGGAFVRTLQAFDAVRWHKKHWPSTQCAAYWASGLDPDLPWTSMFPDSGLPIRSVLGMLMLFSIVVGPLCVAYSRKKMRPGLLLVAVPLVSLVATILIVGYGLVRQGFGTEGFAHSLTLVDQVEKRATSALRRELIMGRGGQTLQPLPSSTVLVPARSSGSQTRVMEQKGNQITLSGDFLPVRTRTGHIVMSTGTTRARLEWTAPDGDSMTVTNALGVDLQMLEVMAPDGRLFAAEGNIEKGGTAKLRERQRGAVRGVLEVAQHEPIFDGVELPLGGYLALSTEAGPGTDDASVEMEELKYLHGIVGYLDLDPQKWSR